MPTEDSAPGCEHCCNSIELYYINSWLSNCIVNSWLLNGISWTAGYWSVVHEQLAIELYYMNSWLLNCISWTTGYRTVLHEQLAIELYYMNSWLSNCIVNSWLSNCIVNSWLLNCISWTTGYGTVVHEQLSGCCRPSFSFSFISRWHPCTQNHSTHYTPCP